MRYVLQVVLSNAQHPEYGQATIPFPIPNQNYDSTIELLGPLEIGDTLRQDCQVDELDSFYTVLNTLIGTQVTLDELDYLAKRLDSFDDGEAAQFQGMAHKLGLSEIKDLINLTFCCQKITVITDFSDLEKIGREHYMNLNGGCARTEDLEALDGTETAYLLIDSEAGTVTPYGVVYDNGMKLEPLYNGRQFPEYLYDNSGMGLKIVPAENQAPELLWLPASEQQIRRTLLRTGWQDPDHADYTIDVFLLQKEVGEILDEKRDSLDSLNAMCGAIAKLDQKDRAKLEAVIIFAEPENAGEICRLAENLDQFDFIPGVHTPKEYGKYMIQESGRFGYKNHLHQGRFDRAMDAMELAAAMALSSALREFRQMGKVVSPQQGAERLRQSIQPHHNRGSLKNRADEIAMELQRILAQKASAGICGRESKESLAYRWLELAASCAKVPIRYEADQIKQRQKEEQAQRGAGLVME